MAAITPNTQPDASGRALLVYDGSMAGFLTCIFEVYERRLGDVKLEPEHRHQPSMLYPSAAIDTDAMKARRVWRGLCAKLSPDAQQQFFSAYLSELPAMEDVLLAYARHVFANAQNVETDYAYAPMLEVQQTARKVWREKHRMEAFVRFQHLQDGLWYAAIEPDYNVLPLISAHFKSRYADMPWLIYDLRRRYGIHYQPQPGVVSEVQMEWTEGSTATPDATVLEATEQEYQTLWQTYFKHTGIPARKNMKLHLRHIPTRYWKYLTEKKGAN